MITTYTELLTAIDNFLNRTDLAGRKEEFVALCEAGLRRVVRSSQTTVVTVPIPTSGIGVVPDGTIAIKSIYLLTPHPGRVLQTSPSMFYQYRDEHPYTSKPVWFAMFGNEFRVTPLPDEAYTAELLIEGPFVPLSGTNLSNWLLTDHPDLYLYGSLLHSAPYLRHDERIPVWQSLYDKALVEMAESEQRKLWPGPLVVDPPVTMP